MEQIYLMARYSRYQEMQHVARHIEARGHVVVSRWIRGEHEASDEAIATGTLGLLERQFALEDLQDLASATCCVSFSERSRTPSRGGRHVEFGLALAMGKRLIAVGGSEHVFHALPQVEHVHDLAALLTLIEKSSTVFLAKNHMPPQCGKHQGGTDHSIDTEGLCHG